jgi:hypothetical protein
MLQHATPEELWVLPGVCARLIDLFDTKSKQYALGGGGGDEDDSKADGGGGSSGGGGTGGRGGPSGSTSGGGRGGEVGLAGVVAARALRAAERCTVDAVLDKAFRTLKRLRGAGKLDAAGVRRSTVGRMGMGGGKLAKRSHLHIQGPGVAPCVVP